MTENLMRDYADLEIRLLKREEKGYPVEMTLNNNQEFQGGYLKPDDLLPWVASANSNEDGERLFDLLFADQTLKRQWAEIRGRSPQRRVRLRIAATAPELHAIPWELLRDATLNRSPQTLATAGETPFSRYLADEWSPGEPLTDRPIKLLVAIANPDNLDDFNLAPIDIAAEQGLIEAALEDLKGEAEATFLEGPITLSALEAELKNGYHLLYLMAYGSVSTKRQTISLYLADLDNEVRVIKAPEFAEMIGRQAQKPQLVLLASCHSAARSPADAFRGLAPALVQAGVPLVLAMQDRVPLETARKFAGTFYCQLLDHGLADLASNEARSALLAAGLPGSSIPVLFSRLINNQLLTPARSLDLTQAERVYRERLKAHYAEEASYYIPLRGETTEVTPVVFDKFDPYRRRPGPAFSPSTQTKSNGGILRVDPGRTRNETGKVGDVAGRGREVSLCHLVGRSGLGQNDGFGKRGLSVCR